MNLLKFIEQLRDTYKNAYAKMKAELVRNEEAKKKHEENSKVYSAKALREEYTEMTQKHAENMKAIITEVQGTIESVRAEYEKEACAEYQPKGEALNAADVALLNSGILLSEHEVERMVQKYADNITMLRVIEDYAKKNSIATTSEAKVMFLKASNMVDVAMRAFDAFVSKARMTLDLMRYNDPKNETFATCNAKIEQYVEDYKSEMNTGLEERKGQSI